VRGANAASTISGDGRWKKPGRVGNDCPATTEWKRFSSASSSSGTNWSSTSCNGARSVPKSSASPNSMLLLV